MRINLENRNANTTLSPEHYYKLFLFVGLFFLIASALAFKFEASKATPKFDELFITEGVLKRSFSASRHHPKIVIQSKDGRLIWLSIYRDYGFHKLIKLKDNKLKVWWYSDNLNPFNSPHRINWIYQAEIDGEIIIKYNEEKELIERNSINGTVFLTFISAIFLLLALVGYLNKVDSKKSPKL